jgi:hypothetical protein
MEIPMENVAQDPSETMSCSLDFRIVGRKAGSLGNAAVEIHSAGDGRTSIKVDGGPHVEILTTHLLRVIRHLDLTEGRNP